MNQFNHETNIFKGIQECLLQKDFRQYSAKVENINVKYDPYEYTNSSKNIQLSLMAASKTKNVFEEILVFDEIGLVGALGGSLGLFVGFSFLGFITTCVETVIDRMENIFS